MPRPLIFDLDGVLRLWDPAIMSDAERDAGVPRGSLTEVVFGNHDLLQRAVTGDISDSEWRHQIVRELTACTREDAAINAVTLWSRSRGSISVEVLELIRAQRSRRHVAILSNATSRLDEDLSALGLDREVDTVINSSTLGVAKPDPMIFRRVSQLLGTALSDCVFVDDTRAHVEAAALLGMVTHLFTTPSNLRTFLAESGAP